IERIQLNDDSMWPGSAEWDNPEGNKKDLEQIRKLLFQNRNKEADALVVEKFSQKSIIRSHQTLGDLYINLGFKDVKNYQRELNLNTACVDVKYIADGSKITQKVFASAADQVIVIKFSSDSENGFSGKIQLTRPMDNGQPTVITTAENNQLKMSGEVTQRNGMFKSEKTEILHGVKFETRISVRNKGGIVKSQADYLLVNNVKELILILVSNSSFYHDDFKKINENQLKLTARKSFDELLNDHIADYQKLYNRVDLNLGKNLLDSLTTDKRLERIKSGNSDPDLEAILFQYGRYLLISSSRTGTNPANLQGLWNEHIQAPWNADYHLNINLQMNYWPADVTNLGELNEPLFDYVDRLIERGKATARDNFGCRGSFLPHASDLWAPAFLRASTAYWGCSFGAAGWMMQHYWQHYKFTTDIKFLKKRVYPALNEVAHFYFDWLIKDPRDGFLISAPSTSPENQYIMANDDTVATCLGSAMDQQVIAEVFDNYIETCRLLNIENAFLDSLKIKRSNLRPGVVLGSDGRILEWDREYQELEKGHRHMSHLYAFHPGNYISKDTPELFNAARKTLDYRLEHGGAGTGWSRAWLINLAARLQDGNMAHEHIQLLLKKSMYINLFDAHPPFQIDGNFGYTAGIAEMLLQSRDDNQILLLPALPDVWKNGYVSGLKARGNFVVDIEWQNNQLENATITSIGGGKTKIVYNDTEIDIQLKAGEQFTFRK
ncbi:MAG: glycoside hydrolase family 95 protein, partial [Calditrichae bacterium]|nr:glycoside hydrolase family 95 protein [Calditrichia bacterium]